jgi:putative hydrolase of the HAD superfamily
MLRALVFDLDDTLYPEKDFMLSGCRAVAGHLAEKQICTLENAFSAMMGTLQTNGRHMVFPMLLERFPEAHLSISELVGVYRQHKPAIQLLPGYLGMLRKLSRVYRLGIITDGLPSVQERKVHALGLRGVMDKIIYTWEYGSEKEKPHPLPFSLMLQYLRAEPGSVLYVGNNADKDCRGAHGVGMKYAQIQAEGSSVSQSDMAMREQPEYIIETLLQLPQILQRVN